MRRFRRTLIISLGLFVLGAAPALAEVRSGEQTDAVGDATVGTGGFGTPDAQLLDVTYVSASYDSNTGTLNASFSGDLPNGQAGYSDLHRSRSASQARLAVAAPRRTSP